MAWLVDRRDKEEWTALMFSVDMGMGEVVRLLLDGQRAADIAW